MDKKNFLILIASTVLAAFLGSFFASLIFFGQRSIPHPNYPWGHIPEPVSVNIDIPEPQKMMKDQQEFFDKFKFNVEDSTERDLRHGGFFYVNNSELKAQETKDAYKITFDLKPFGNNPKNVIIKANDHGVFISAQYKLKNKNEISSAKFRQELVLPAEINEDKITKVKEGNFLIITVPKDL